MDWLSENGKLFKIIRVVFNFIKYCEDNADELNKVGYELVTVDKKREVAILYLLSYCSTHEREIFRFILLCLEQFKQGINNLQISVLTFSRAL